jgi:uncharacterized protein
MVVLPPSITRWLNRTRYVSLITYRRSGEGVATPVWFAWDGAVAYMYSDSTAGKVKRIRHTPHVSLAPCNAQGRLLEGETVRGSAHLLETAEDIALAQRAIQRKYGWRYLGYHLLNVAMQRVRPQNALQFSWIAIRLHDAHDAMTT